MAHEATIVNKQCAGRDSGRAIIRRQIERYRQNADSLEMLLGLLPDELTREQDEAIWQIFIRRVE